MTELNNQSENAKRKLLAALGMCQKAMKLVSGEAACEKALQVIATGKEPDATAKLIIIAADASENTRKKFVNKAFFYKVPCYHMTKSGMDRDEISKAIGRQNRATLAVTDEGFASRIEEMLKSIEGVTAV